MHQISYAYNHADRIKSYCTDNGQGRGVSYTRHEDGSVSAIQGIPDCSNPADKYPVVRLTHNLNSNLTSE